MCDKLAAMKKSIDNLSKVFTLARGLRSKYKDFKTAMLSKAPYPNFNQFVLALKVHEQMNQIELKEENVSLPNMNQAYYSQRGRGRGRGRHTSISRGRGFNPAEIPHHNIMNPETWSLQNNLSPLPFKFQVTH